MDKKIEHWVMKNPVKHKMQTGLDNAIATAKNKGYEIIGTPSLFRGKDPSTQDMFWYGSFSFYRPVIDTMRIIM